MKTISRFIALTFFTFASVSAEFLSPSPMFADTISIVSDSSWRSTDSVVDRGSCPAGAIGTEGPSWTTLGFDDTGWRNPKVCPIDPPLIPGSFTIWDDDGIPDCTHGSLEAFFRRPFTLGRPVVSASAKLIADDEFQFYVNGKLVAEDLSGESIPLVTVDIASFLQVGNNVLAIRAWDGSFCSIFDRVGKSLTVAVTIITEDIETCNDGVDNDNDGFVDCDDPDCSGYEGCVCSCPTDSCPDKGCISGLVEDADTGLPLAGKLVKLKRIFPKGAGMTSSSIVTDTGGCYGFSNLDDGTYMITVTGCKGGGKKVVVISGRSKEEGKNFRCK